MSDGHAGYIPIRDLYYARTVACRCEFSAGSDTGATPASKPVMALLSAAGIRSGFHSETSAALQCSSIARRPR